MITRIVLSSNREVIQLATYLENAWIADTSSSSILRTLRTQQLKFAAQPLQAGEAAHHISDPGAINVLHIFQIEQNLSVTLAGQASDHIAEHSPTSRAESECFAHADAPAQIKDRNLSRLTDLVFQHCGHSS
jgi:hypothetical protein